MKSNRNNRKVAVIIIVAALVILGGFLVYRSLSSPVKSVVEYIEKGEDAAANTLYKEKILGNEKYERDLEKEVDKLLRDNIDSYQVGNRSFEDGVELCDTIIEASIGISSEKGKEQKILLSALNPSKIAYNKGLEYEEGEKFMDALLEFTEVIPEDTNYEDAQKRIGSIIEEYKPILLKEIDSFIEEKNIEDASALVNLALTVIKDDNELLKKKEEIEKMMKDNEMKSLKEALTKLENDQLLTIEGIKITGKDSTEKDGASDLVQVIVKNMSNKTVKGYKFSLLAYDDKGVPIEMEGALVEGSAYEVIGTLENITIPPNKTFGTDQGLAIKNNEKIHKFIACVISAEFTDGTQWANEYYNYWSSLYKGKNIKP